jgi:hypothetical protein
MGRRPQGARTATMRDSSGRFGQRRDCWVGVRRHAELLSGARHHVTAWPEPMPTREPRPRRRPEVRRVVGNVHRCDADEAVVVLAKDEHAHCRNPGTVPPRPTRRGSGGAPSLHSMKRDDIEAMVRDWLDQASVDPRTGLPPDAKVRVTAHYITTIGHLEPGGAEPESGLSAWSVTATLYFPEASDTWADPNDMGLEVAQVLSRLEQSLEQDRTLGRSGIEVGWRGIDGDRPHQRRDAPAGYEYAVDVHLSVRDWSLD